MAKRRVATLGVYRIRNSATGKCYVGSSVDVRARLATHFASLAAGTHHSEKLQRAWKKHGAAAFDTEILEVVERAEDLLVREQHWMDTLQAVARGYNICPKAGNILGIVRSAETRQKLSDCQKGRIRKPHSPEHKQNISAANKGRVKTPEWRKKLSEAHLGRPKSPEHRKNLAAANTGKPRSDATKARISVAHKGRVKSAAERANISAGQKARTLYPPLTAEHRAAISAGNLGRKQTPERVAKRVASSRRTRAAKARTVPKQLSLF